jgi:hypothetical protein
MSFITQLYLVPSSRRGATGATALITIPVDWVFINTAF